MLFVPNKLNVVTPEERTALLDWAAQEAAARFLSRANRHEDPLEQLLKRMTRIAEIRHHYNRK